MATPAEHWVSSLGYLCPKCLRELLEGGRMVLAHSFKDFASKTPVYEQYVRPQPHTNVFIRYVLGYVCMNTVVCPNL